MYTFYSQDILGDRLNLRNENTNDKKKYSNKTDENKDDDDNDVDDDDGNEDDNDYNGNVAVDDIMTIMILTIRGRRSEGATTTRMAVTLKIVASMATNQNIIFVKI